jgi:hypothetical protein
MRRHIMSLFSENAKLKGGPWMGSCWVQMMVWCCDDGDDCMVKIWWLWWHGSDKMVMMIMVDGSGGWYGDRQVGSSSRCSCYSCVIMAMIIMMTIIMYIWW